MRLAAVYFSNLVALNEGDRVQSLHVAPDDGSGDPSRVDILERLDDGTLLFGRIGGPATMMVNQTYVAVLAPEPAGEKADAAPPAPPAVSPSPAASGAGTAQKRRRGR